MVAWLRIVASQSGFTIPYHSPPLAELTPLVILVVWWGGITKRYQGLACGGRRFLVGLVPITILYHASILGGILALCAFTSRRSPLGGTTHSGWDCVLCGVIMDHDVDAMTGTCVMWAD
jgi:hypothetical protein